METTIKYDRHRVRDTTQLTLVRLPVVKTDSKPTTLATANVVIEKPHRPFPQYEPMELH